MAERIDQQFWEASGAAFVIWHAASRRTRAATIDDVNYLYTMVHELCKRENETIAHFKTIRV